MDSDEIYDVCTSSLHWAKERDYKGYDPYDGLNSPILDFFARNWFTRLLAIHGVNKAPVNLRPILRVPKERNPKGIALFASAYLNLYEQTGQKEFLVEAESLLDWLSENQSPFFDLPSWGYNFDWQNGRKFFLPAYYPSIVVTIFCGRVFQQHYELIGDEKSLKMAIEVADFIQTKINTDIFKGYEVYTYTPYDSFIVINANALAAGYFYRVSLESENKNLQIRAEELFEFICDAQDPKGAWYYSMPASDSHLSHDNFHTGFILESIYEYAIKQKSDSRVRLAYQNGMEFYKEKLFESDGAPKFESDKPYPYDIHAAAQGILTLVQRGNNSDTQLAKKILNWVLKHLYDNSGSFHRRKGRLLKDRAPYIRWSQAWMCNALSYSSHRL